MTNHEISFRILERTLREWEAIALQLGDEAHQFADRLRDLLAALDGPQEEQWARRVDALVDVGVRSAARELFREIVALSMWPGLTRAGYRLNLSHYTGPKSPPPSPAFQGAAAAAPLRRAAGGLAEAVAATTTTPRYLNAGFFAANEDQPLDTARPLSLAEGPYRLGVNVGRFWGPGSPGTPFPENTLAAAFEQNPVLELDVAPRSATVTFSPPRTRLPLSRTGDTPLLFLQMTLARAGRQVVDVDLLYHNHLLQSRRTEVHVAEGNEELPRSAWPVQDGYLTFTRTGALDPLTLGPLASAPSPLTVVVERDLDGRIGLRFYSRPADGADQELGAQESSVQDRNLKTWMDKARGLLKGAMSAYAGLPEGSPALLAQHLGPLAEAGREFYLALLPALADRAPRLSLGLQPGQTLQVAPLSPQLGVPWEVLYERPVESFDPAITVCPAFREHGPGPEQCPHHGNPRVVCPHGFWGYRYVIEQLPCRARPGGPLPGTLPLHERNGLPLRFSAVVGTTLTHWRPHLDALQALAPAAGLELTPLETKDSVRQALRAEARPAEVLYFYTHGGSDGDSSFLSVGADGRIKLIDLEAWDLSLTRQRPLVVLNACDSAAYSPESFENLIQFFCDRGAAGVVGTQCEVRELLAGAFCLDFFSKFFRQASLGDALFDARRALLFDCLDPRGLAYSLFAAAEVRLGQPVLT
jgi:hypothetical protein